MIAFNTGRSTLWPYWEATAPKEMS